jgi:hypothetical protein
MAEPEPEAPSAEPVAQRPWRGRLARILLVVGIALAATRLLPSVPRDQELVFRVADPASVRRIAASWTAVGQREPLGAVTLSFSAGPPARVHHRVSLPNGRYDIAIEIARETDAGALSHTSSTRQVTLEGGETVIPVENER